MRYKRLRQNEIRQTRKEEHQAIERDRPWGIVILTEPSCRERRQRKPKEQMQVRPKDWSRNTFGGMQ